MLAERTDIKTPLKPFYRSRWFKIPLVLVPVLLPAGYAGVCIYGSGKFNRHGARVKGSYGANTPAKYGLEYEEVNFTSAANPNLALRGWWIPNTNSNRALMVVHGRDADRTRQLMLTRPLYDRGYNLLYFDLQGHGLSDGKRYYFGQKEKWDILAAFNFIKSRGIDSDRIGIVAHSLGAAAALLALPLAPEIKVVSSNATYADFGLVAKGRFSKDTGLPGFFLPGIFAATRLIYGFDAGQARPESVLQQVHDRKLMLVHGDADTDIPFEQYQRLLKAGGCNVVDTWVIPGGNHEAAFEQHAGEYVARLTAFFDKYLGS